MNIKVSSGWNLRSGQRWIDLVCVKRGAEDPTQILFLYIAHFNKEKVFCAEEKTAHIPDKFRDKLVLLRAKKCLETGAVDWYALDRGRTEIPIPHKYIFPFTASRITKDILLSYCQQAIMNSRKNWMQTYQNYMFAKACKRDIIRHERTLVEAW